MRLLLLFTWGLVLLLISPITAYSQQRWISNNLELWPEAQVELVLQDGDYVFGAFSLRHVPNADIRAATFVAVQGQAGYEHFWNQHWSMGGTFRVFSMPDLEGTELTPELLVRHVGQAGDWQFGQRLGLAYNFPRGGGTGRLFTRGIL